MKKAIQHIEHCWMKIETGSVPFNKLLSDVWVNHFKMCFLVIQQIATVEQQMLNDGDRVSFTLRSKPFIHLFQSLKVWLRLLRLFSGHFLMVKLARILKPLAIEHSVAAVVCDKIFRTSTLFHTVSLEILKWYYDQK